MDIEKVNNTIFESIKHIDEEGREYWLARELQKALKYKEWRNFLKVLNKAKEACNNSKFNVDEQLVEINKLSKRNNNAIINIQDYKMSRYICYLLVQNADPSKDIVALGQTYFAIQTRRQELLGKDYDLMSEDEKRLYRRKQVKESNKSLNRIASLRGVKNFDKFTNAGYKGLYNGETANDIARRKQLRYREDILDNMGSIELGANIFRITQTEDLLTRQELKSEKFSCNTHYEVGKKVRKAIADIGGTMHEDLPTPKKSLKELDKYNDEIIEK